MPAQSEDYLLRIKGLTKTYNHEVLKIDDLIIARGKIYGIIGPSGTGKSTLLRLINMLEKPTKGEIEYRFSGNNNVREINDFMLQRQMTLVFQKPLLFRASVWDNIYYGLKARGSSKKNASPKINDILTKVGLSGLSGRDARTLSGGEAQRVALARAVVFEPELLLLDEPTANLDPGNIELIEQIITELNREKGTTIIMVTHNIFQARRLVDEVIYILKGCIEETGKTENIFHSPLKETTRAFVEGRMIY